MKRDILDLPPRKLETQVADWRQARFRAGQILEWIYKKDVRTFAEMTNLPKALRQRFAAEFEICRPTVARRLVSKLDGSSKFVIRLFDGRLVETVLIPSERRLTLCVSTQVGCRFGCKFCASGAGGFVRNLTAGEIVAQMMLASRAAGPAKITHVVFMGMGEPLDNLKSTVDAALTINSELGFNIGWRRITVSTVGIPGTVEELIRHAPQIGLSFSLHAPNDELRERIIPANRRFSVGSIIATARHCFRETGRLPTFEYVLIEGWNASTGHARALVELLSGIRCKVNLIPLNPASAGDLSSPGSEQTLRFLSVLERGGVKATIRHSRGADIIAACGQLACPGRPVA